MSISIQTLHDTLIALVATVGLAVFVSIVMIAVGGLFEHRKDVQHADTHRVGPPQHAVQDDDIRELVSH